MEDTEPEGAIFGNLTRLPLVELGHEPSHGTVNPHYSTCRMCWGKCGSELVGMASQ